MGVREVEVTLKDLIAAKPRPLGDFVSYSCRTPEQGQEYECGRCRMGGPSGTTTSTSSAAPRCNHSCHNREGGLG